ncbi:hypothetical protein ACZ11_04505 [Lysinibacillus xylanilyticus]|uniref:Uncharacterized protein n=1 Tax=Lysinibacillus xylanilyticus TaxID=582475 RepID=A0A0K9FBA5_9BACI|nr:hypothetical protein ACZ11_04505 [Lysinibacillus xylanilyticus]
MTLIWVHKRYAPIKSYAVTPQTKYPFMQIVSTKKKYEAGTKPIHIMSITLIIRLMVDIMILQMLMEKRKLLCFIQMIQIQTVLVLHTHMLEWFIQPASRKYD